ncbi:outer membrane protein transport protein [Pontiellaceae bacterium B12227]|nr:outer membrane protein transport protein [Pontiellaceae bacterium B12227]
MNKNYKKGATLLCCYATSIASIHSAFADGYRNPPPTAEGIAKSGANSVWVDDASAISYNPANLALQTNASVVISTTFAQVDNTYQNPLAASSFESDGDWNFLGNFYYGQPIGDSRWAVGLGITTPYGQGISWDKADFEPFVGPAPGIQQGMIPYEASVIYLNFNPTVAYQLSDSLSLGFGLDFAYSELELKALLDPSAFGAPLLPDVHEAKATGDGFGFGANAGLTWLPVEGHRLALTYRSQTKITYKGDFEAPTVPPAGLNGDFETEIKYPDMVSLGYGVQLSERVLAEVMVEWMNWSVNESQPLDIEGVPAPDLENNWDDTFTFGLGGSWQALDSLVVRAGYAFIPTPIPDETITHLLPDADRHAISFGLGYRFWDAHTLDLAYTISIYEDRSAPITGAGPGTYEIDSNLIGLTYSASF